VRYCNSSAKVKKKSTSGAGARWAEEERTAFWTAGLFCTAVLMIHNACTFTSSEGEAGKPCSGSHMPSFSRSHKRTRIFHIGVRNRVRVRVRWWKACPKSDKADQRQQQHACVTIRIVDVLDELGTSSREKKKHGNRREGLPFRDRPAPSDAHRRRGTHPAPLRAPPSSALSRACRGSRR
jgi:hypothetical protein